MKCLRISVVVLFCAAAALAAGKEHATLVREAALYAKAGTDSEKIGRVDRGSDLLVLERNNAAPDSPQWFKVTVTSQDEGGKEVTGWVSTKALILASTPNGDEIVYGEAVDSEHQAEQRGGRKGAAEDAQRLYQRTADFFPNSPLAGEALWRAADIRWQLDRARGKRPIDEQAMKDVIKRFPQTKWADLAAYEMLDNQLCGEWKGQAACPASEAEIYERYAREHPQSPKAVEAFYNAAWRYGVIADVYRVRADQERSATARKKAIALAQEVASQASQSEWKSRAAALIYKLEQDIALYGATE